jgi:RNA polymerase sigma-70 factor (ECF subfamily)
MYRYARRHGLQDADAADLTQEAMGEVARAIRSLEYHPERGRFRDWLRTVTRRRLARFRKFPARCPEPPGGAEALEQVEHRDEGPDPDWNEAFHAQVLRTALQRIQPGFEPVTWRAFERVWVENRSAAETAGELSLRIDLVYLAKSRVLKRLEQEVREIAEDFSWLEAIEL